MANKPDYSVIVSTRAQKELAESWTWYEDRLPSLGDRFLREVLKRIRQIEENPDRFPTKFKAYKETQVDTGGEEKCDFKWIPNKMKSGGG
jgi:hypothetical protein